MRLSENPHQLSNPTPPDRSTFVLAVLFFLATLFLFSGCRTKKSVIDKKEEKITSLEYKDVVTSEKEGISTSTIDLSNSKSWSLTPLDSQKPSKVIYKGDTLSLSNAKLEVNENQNNSRTNTVISKEKKEEDQSSIKLETETESKYKTNDVKSASWGLNIGLILGFIALGIILYLNVKKPG